MSIGIIIVLDLPPGITEIWSSVGLRRSKQTTTFANKLLDKLIREGIKPEHMNDKILVITLDELFEQDVSKVYSKLAIKVVTHIKLPCDALNLDGTGFYVDGRYNCNDEENDEELNCIRLCKGYSRDHRPDLNQAIGCARSLV